MLLSTLQELYILHKLRKQWMAVLCFIHMLSLRVQTVVSFLKSPVVVSKHSLAWKCEIELFIGSSLCWHRVLHFAYHFCVLLVSWSEQKEMLRVAEVENTVDLAEEWKLKGKELE